jgi:hypothetical protein
MGCRVYDERQLFWTAIAKGVDQDVGKSGAAKARYENGRSIRNVGESLCCGARSFVHRHRWYASLFLNQQLFLEILSDLACPSRKFYPGEFACSRITENSRSPNVAVSVTRSGPQLFCWWDGTRQLGEIRMSTHLRLVRSRTRP